jgi:hypothetical protein
MDKIEIKTRTVEERGIELPWERWSYPAVFKDGVNLTPERPHPSVLEEFGTVFITMSDLYALSEQDIWDSQFGSALLLGTHEGLALVAAGLAVLETKGGYHRTDKLLALIEELENA